MFGRYEANDQAEEDMQTEENRVTGSLAGLAFALFLVVVGLYLVQNLASKARLEDCLLSGRVNCDAMLSTIR
jgi:hypothetical protein